jgi:hypothetical protein
MMFCQDDLSFCDAKDVSGHSSMLVSQMSYAISHHQEVIDNLIRELKSVMCELDHCRNRIDILEKVTAGSGPPSPPNNSPRRHNRRRAESLPDRLDEKDITHFMKSWKHEYRCHSFMAGECNNLACPRIHSEVYDDKIVSELKDIYVSKNINDGWNISKIIRNAPVSVARKRLINHIKDLCLS